MGISHGQGRSSAPLPEASQQSAYMQPVTAQAGPHRESASGGGPPESTQSSHAYTRNETLLQHPQEYQGSRSAFNFEPPSNASDHWSVSYVDQPTHRFHRQPEMGQERRPLQASSLTGSTEIAHRGRMNSLTPSTVNPQLVSPTYASPTAAGYLPYQYAPDTGSALSIGQTFASIDESTLQTPQTGFEPESGFNQLAALRYDPYRIDRRRDGY
ncbi:hypothetical protein IAU59_000604 [Kwoniella sp. CBS 9459]